MKRTCELCKKVIPLDEQCFQIILGKFHKDDFGGEPFDKVDSGIVNPFCYIHFDCLKVLEGEVVEDEN
jgi:hypothetical protein